MELSEFLRKKKKKKYLLIGSLAPGGGGVSDLLDNLTEGGFLDRFQYDQLPAENLLKAADDLTDGVYWSYDDVTVTDQGDGVFRATKDIAATAQDFYQSLTNWAQPWFGEVSLIFEARAGNASEVSAVLRSDAPAAIIDDAEVVSGSGNASVSSGIGHITNLDSNWTKIRVSGSCKGSLLAIAQIYPDFNNADSGAYIDVRNVQVVLGNEVKPRPVGQEADYPMMSYRPHWRKTLDNKARVSVVDTEGLGTCGEMTDGLIEPANATPVTANADCEFNIQFTYEIGKYIEQEFRKADSSNLMVVKVTAPGALQLSKIVAGSSTTIDTVVGVFSDGVAYRVRFNALSSSIKVYVDDKVEINETETDNATNTGARVLHNYATNDIKITTETNPKAKGLIIAGGKATPAYGDPGIWYTQPDGSAFDGVATKAALFTATTFVATKNAQFGFDDATSGQPLEPRGKLQGAYLYADTAGGNETPQDWAVGSAISWMQILRSDTHGSHFFIHESGNQWKRFNVNADPIPASLTYPCVSNYNAMLSSKRIALINLKDHFQSDFAEVLVSDATVTSGESHTHGTAAQSGEITITPDGSLTRQDYYPLYIGAVDHLIFWHNTGSTSFTIAQTIGGSYDSLGFVGGIFSASTPTTIKWVLNQNRTVSIFVDNVLKLATTAFDSSLLVATQDHASFSAGTMTDLTINPYPQLGMATDRIIAPQQGDAATDASDDGHSVIRNIVLGSIDRVWDWREVDTDNRTVVLIGSAGNMAFQDYNGGYQSQPISVGVGEINSGDDVAINLNGEAGEVFANGVSKGSAASGFTHMLGNGFYALQGGIGLSADAIEFWKYFETMPFRFLY